MSDERPKEKQTIQPDRQDYETADRECGGPLPDDATDAQCAERYRLAQTAKLIRLYEQGKLPLPEMREMDKLRDKLRRQRDD